MSQVAATKTFAHGVHPPDNKAATKDLAVEPIPLAPELCIPLAQHIGAPAKAIVKKKQEVARGEVIAEPGGFVSVPMHAPAAGTVSKIDVALVANGSMVPSITIKVDEAAGQTPQGGDVRDLDALTPEDIVSAVQNTGMVGLGGAAFPSHVKMIVPKGKTVDTVIINGCECEPYLTTDHRVMLEQMVDLFTGVRIALKATSAERAIVGVEANKPDVIEALRKGLPSDAPITVEPVKTKYPQGAEKMLIKALLNREVPSGALPADAGAAVFNVATLTQLAQLIPASRGLIERVVTVTGPAVKKPGNYMVPMGTPVRFLLEHAGFNGSARQVVLGGPMMGMAVSSLDIPVTKGVSGILTLGDKEIHARAKKVYPCIRCGSCVNACPIFLNPSRLALLGRKDEYETMEKSFHLNDCFECGCCTYVCPSNIPIVHYLRVAKAVNRERNAAQ